MLQGVERIFLDSYNISFHAVSQQYPQYIKRGSFTNYLEMHLISQSAGTFIFVIHRE